MTLVNHFANICEKISCHCWNGDATRVAYSPCSKDIIIAKVVGNTLVTEAVLKQHDARVTGIDWAPNNNTIVSCSEDRNAYVWSETTDEETKKKGKSTWEPVLVMLRIEFAATDVKWSPNEMKFACSSGNKLVAICTFKEETNWWSSEHVKHFKSTVSKIAWSPDSLTIAATGTDRTVKIVNAFVKGVDPKESYSPFSEQVLSSPKCKLGTFLFETEKDELWINSVAFTPDGQTVVYVTQTSKICFINANEGHPTVQTVETESLPFLDVLCLSNTRVIAVGHNFNPCLFEKQGDEWKFVKMIDQPKAQQKGGMSARDKFKSLSARGTAEFKTAAEQIPTTHKNTVTCVRAMKYDDQWNVTEFTTSSMDGSIIQWKA